MEDKRIMMKNNSFEYFLNAVHYCIYQYEVRSSRRVDKIVWICFFAVAKVFSLEKRCNRRREELDNDAKYQEYMYGNNAGLSIGLANHWFGYLYSGYSIFVSFFLIGIAEKRYEYLNSFVVFLFFAIPIGLCYIPAYRAVFSNDRYLKYHKQFEKKDERWHRKWKWITIAFCVGSFATAIAGIFVMSAVGRSFLRWTVTI